MAPPGRIPHILDYTAVDLASSYTPPAIAGIGTPQTTYTYNRDKQLQRVVRPDGLTIQVAYNAASGRASQLQIPTGSYDFAFLLGGRNSAINAPGAENLTYGWDGPLVTSVTWAGPVSGTVNYSYDNNFWLAHLIAAGTAVDYTYDADGLLTAARHGTESLTLARDPQNGLLTGTALASVTDAWHYNQFAEPTQYSASYNGAELFKTVLTRDANGRIRSKAETVAGATTLFEYGYDVAGRLSTVTRNGVLIESYGHDDNSNRINAAFAGAGISASGCAAGLTTATATVDGQDRLKTYGNCSFGYKANGELESKTNVVTSELTGFEYDVLGNLRRVTLPNGDIIDYVMDGQHRRVGKKVNGVLVQGFLYLNQLKPVVELDGSGNTRSVFVYADRVNVPSYMLRGSHTYRIVSDHLGSPRMVVDVADGAIVQRIEYDSWGNVSSDSNPGFQPFGFAGGLAGVDGVVRLGTRDYDPQLGRFISKDYAGVFGGSPSSFIYAFGDPINFIDANGGWAAAAHNYLIEQALLGLNKQLVEAAMDGSAQTDAIVKQFLAPSSQHAMRDPGQTQADACDQANNFIRDNLDEFKRFIERARQFQADGNHPMAGTAAVLGYQHLGMALHTIMDSTSPAHAGFQEWDITDWSTVRRHGDNFSSSEESLVDLLMRPELVSKTLDMMHRGINGQFAFDCDCYRR